jgi:hypothetical protein
MNIFVYVLVIALLKEVYSLHLLSQTTPGRSLSSGIHARSATRLAMVGEGGNAASRRRNRRGKGKSAQDSIDSSTKTPTSESVVPDITNRVDETRTESIIVNKPSSRSTPSSNVQDPALAYANRAAYGTVSSSELKDDGTASIEDMFGLGNDQLRELMETELPVPREDLITKKKIEEEDQDQDKVFALPDLGEFIDNSNKEKTPEEEAADAEKAAQRIDRSNQEEYMRVMQLNPFADADDTMFTEEYDIFPSIFGSGKLLGIPVPYLQTGHGILLIICVLAGYIYAPGNPLTEFPLEIRNFLKTGLTVVYSINAVLAVQAYFEARSKNLPALFWSAKTFVLGGVAFFEIKKAQDPTKPAAQESKSFKSDRKSQNREQTQFKR